MDKSVEEFIGTKNLAVVGVSHTPTKFGNMIYKELKERGYQVFAVNASLSEVEGEPCYPSLEALKGKIDGAVICIQPQKAGDVLREASRMGLKKIWLQQGSESLEVLKTAEELGLKPVTRKCILMYAQPVKSFHGVHRFFAKIFGGL